MSNLNKCSLIISKADADCCSIPEQDALLGFLVLLLRVLHVHEGGVGIGLLGIGIGEGRFVTKRRGIGLVF